MDDIDPDTMMVLAGVMLSLLVLKELYSSWRRTRGGRVM
jgi:hypothetical protein